MSSAGDHRLQKTWTLAKESLGVTPPKCRECDEDVAFFSELCPHCGVRSPVKLSTWLNFAVIGVTLWMFLLLIF